MLTAFSIRSAIFVIVLTLKSIEGESTFATEEEAKTTAYDEREISDGITAQQYNQVAIILAVVGSLILVLLILAAFALYFKSPSNVKPILYAKGCCLRWLTEEEHDKDKQYDVFISFSHKDEHFVMNELVPKLEGPPCHYRVCVHYRDWFAGQHTADQIFYSIENSKRTIFVLTPDFLDSKWCKYELKIADYFILKDRRIRPIALVYKDVGSLAEIDEELNAYLRTNIFVKWGESWFWEKLYYALPHLPHSSSYVNEDIDLITV